MTITGDEERSFRQVFVDSVLYQGANGVRHGPAMRDWGAGIMVIDAGSLHASLEERLGMYS